MTKLIQCLGKDMIEEAKSAMHYAKMALNLQNTDVALAEQLRKMSQIEMQHAKYLNEQMHSLRTQFEAQKGDRVPEWMKEEFDCMKEKYLCYLEKTQNFLTLY